MDLVFRRNSRNRKSPALLLPRRKTLILDISSVNSLAFLQENYTLRTHKPVFNETLELIKETLQYLIRIALFLVTSSFESREVFP